MLTDDGLMACPKWSTVTHGDHIASRQLADQAQSLDQDRRPPGAGPSLRDSQIKP